jgi:hypothetical protein
MRWGQEAVGVVLTRNEIWLLLHALTAGPRPVVGWDGSELEPWVIGELRSRLQSALSPDPLGDVDQRPIIHLDSDMGRNLAAAGVKPMVVDDGFDLGTLFAACAERGWGAEVRLPLGAIPETPASCAVHVRRENETGEDELETHVGLERPVVALARAFIAACLADAGGGAIGDDCGAPAATLSSTESHVIYLNSIAPGDKEPAIARMQTQGWELVLEETGHSDGRLVFRRPQPLKRSIQRRK